MFYNYIIKSNNKEWFYVGFSEDVDRRFEQHNSGLIRSTKGYKPFNLIFVQITKSINEVRDLEKYLKVRWNKENLLKLIG